MRTRQAGQPLNLFADEFGLRRAEVFGLDPGLLIPGKPADVTMAARRPADVSFDRQKAFALGDRPRRVIAGLSAAKDWNV